MSERSGTFEWEPKRLNTMDEKPRYVRGVDEISAGVYELNEDGTWSPAEPIDFIGWKANLEQWFFRRGMKRAGLFMAWWDERSLGS